MSSWREELTEVVKTKAERDAEEQARQKKRVAEALATAETAMSLGADALRYARDRLVEKEQTAELTEGPDYYKLVVHEQTVALELVRDSAVLRVMAGDAKPREFDFAKDRHIAPTDVDEYMGRRLLELVRAAHKAQPW
jgi:hypothetical protein